MISACWAAGDTANGQHSGLRRRLEARDLHYVLAVPMKQHIIAPRPAGRPMARQSTRRPPARQRLADPHGGDGTKGDRRYSWARTHINGPSETGEHWHCHAGP